MSKRETLDKIAALLGWKYTEETYRGAGDSRWWNEKTQQTTWRGTHPYGDEVNSAVALLKELGQERWTRYGRQYHLTARYADIVVRDTGDVANDLFNLALKFLENKK